MSFLARFNRFFMRDQRAVVSADFSMAFLPGALFVAAIVWGL